MAHPILDSLKKLYHANGNLWIADRGQLIISHPYSYNELTGEVVNYYDEPYLYTIPDSKTVREPKQTLGGAPSHYSHWELGRIARAILQYLLCEGNIDPAMPIHDIYALADSVAALTKWIDAAAESRAVADGIIDAAEAPPEPTPPADLNADPIPF